MAHTTKHFCGTMESDGPRPEDHDHHNTAWHVNEIAFRQMLTWAADSIGAALNERLHYAYSRLCRIRLRSLLLDFGP